MKVQGAFPEETITEYFSPWIKAINSRECITILNIPKRDQLYRVNEFINQQITSKKIQLITLDLKGQIIEDSSDLESYLDKHVKNNSKLIVLLILDADQLLDEKIALLSCLDKMYFDRKNFSMVYLFQKNITSLEKTKKLSPYTSLFQNISIFSCFEPEAMSYFIKFIALSFKTKITKELERKILDRCNGAPWLVKESVRYYYQTGDTKNIFNHDNMKIKLNILYQELSIEEKLVVEKIIKMNFQFDLKEKAVINYLTKTGLLIKKGQQYDVSIPIFKDFIQETINSKTQINLNQNGQLLVNGVLVEGFFSRREKKIIKLFLENKEKILNREGIALAVWSNNKENLYTDWALDQIIRRLRNKFVKLGLSRYLIKTIKNQGYLFNG